MMKATDSFRLAFRQQIDQLRGLVDFLPESEINNAISLVANCSGIFHVIGLGKSGIIAKKISATFVSLGVRSCFVHACDALHGDIGIVSDNDIAMLISNSGETSEVLDIVTTLRSRGVKIIALTGNAQSSLARQADCILHAKISAEACPLNLAPTTSTSAALVIGDSLAIAVMKVRSVSSQQFALNHPAGRLGRRLTMRVSDLMKNVATNPTVSPSSGWNAIITQIVDGHLGAVNVVDSMQNLLGIITDGDIRRALSKNSWMQLEKMTARELMSAKPKTVLESQLAFEALEIMTSHSAAINVLCVVDPKGRSVGLLRLSDLSRAGI